MKSRSSSLLIRQTVFALLVTGVSLPLLYALHRLLGLNNPPLWGLVILIGAVVAAFVGAGAIGALAGQGNGSFRGHSSKTRVVAALCGFLWGGLIVSATASLYTSIILDQLSHGGTSFIWGQRDQLWKHGHQTWQQWRAGGSEEAVEVTKTAAQETANQALDKSKALAWEGVATLPPLSLLLWALIVPPVISAWECRRAARF